MRQFPFQPKHLSQDQERLYRMLVFLLRFGVMALPVYLVMLLALDLYFLELVVASQSAVLLGLMGHQVALSGTGITLESGFQFFIIADCTGWKSMLLLTAIVFAVPGIAIKHRVMVLGIGLPLIWIANLFRIAGVVQAQGLWGTEFALFMHDSVFQIFMIAVALAIWLAWLSKLGMVRLKIPFLRQK